MKLIIDKGLVMSVFKRTDLKNSKPWRAVVRIKGYPTISKTFDRKQEAEDWKREVTQQIKSDKYRFTKLSQKKTVAELIDCYIQDAVNEHHKSADDTKRHLAHFRETLSEYALNGRPRRVALVPSVIQELKKLASWV
jgi:Rps23 Pro-64 3,4-dihydroxylase Tpa1-like proline 4-hydroxylase